MHSDLYKTHALYAEIEPLEWGNKRPTTDEEVATSFRLTVLEVLSFSEIDLLHPSMTKGREVVTNARNSEQWGEELTVVHIFIPVAKLGRLLTIGFKPDRLHPPPIENWKPLAETFVLRGGKGLLRLC